MKFKITLSGLCLLVAVLWGCEKKLKEQSSETKEEGSYWVGAYGIKRGELLNYDNAFGALLRNDGSVRVYTSPWDTTKGSFFDAGSYKFSANSFEMGKISFKKVVEMNFKGQLEEERILGTWQNNETADGLFFLDKQPK